VVEPGESPFQPVALVENAAASLTGLPPYMWPAVEGRLAEWVAPFLAASRDVYIPPLYVGSAVPPRLTVSSAYRGYGPLAIAVPRGEPPLVRPLVSYRPDALDIVDVHLPFMGLIDEYDFDNALGWSIYSAKKYATATRVAICPVVPFLSEAVLESVAVDQIWPLGVDGPAASAVISARITSNLNWRGFVAMLDMVNGWIRDAVAAERARNTGHRLGGRWRCASINLETRCAVGGAGPYQSLREPTLACGTPTGSPAFSPTRCSRLPRRATASSACGTCAHSPPPNCCACSRRCLTWTRLLPALRG
jgi:hypothetical protein